MRMTIMMTATVNDDQHDGYRGRPNGDDADDDNDEMIMLTNQ